MYASVILAIRECVASSSTLIPLNHSERISRKQKEPCAQSLTPFCTYFRRELYLLPLLSLPLPFHCELIIPGMLFASLEPESIATAAMTLRKKKREKRPTTGDQHAIYLVLIVNVTLAMLFVSAAYTKQQLPTSITL